MPFAVPISPAPSITWERFQTSQNFLSLSEKQRLWLSIYLETGDFVFATSSAYKCASREIAKVMSYRVRRSPKIRRALAEFKGDTRDPRADLIETVERHLAASEPGSCAAQRLLGQLERLKLGGAPEVEPAPEPKSTGRPRTRFAIGDIVVQSGQKYRVTEVDSNGKIVNATEVE